MTLPENERQPSGHRWANGAVCGGLVGLGHALNLMLVCKDFPPSDMPGVMLVGAAFIGIAALAGLILTPLFSSDHPVAVAFQGIFLGASIGSFATPFFWMVFLSDGSSGPANQFADAFAVIGLVVMTICGAVGGSVVGLIGWPKLKRILRK
jgi:hypothetical protein